MAYAMHPHESHATAVQTASTLGALAAGWLLFSSFFAHGESTVAWNDRVFAVLIGIFALARAFGASGRSWMSWLNMLMGLWLIVAPWALASRPGAAFGFDNVITGAVIVVLSCWAALATESDRLAEADEARSDRLPPPKL